MFGETMTGGLEAHDFNCNISNRITTPGKKVKGNGDDTTSDNTLTENSSMSTGGKTITTTMEHHAGHDLDEEEDDDSFASSIASIVSTKSNFAENNNAEDFHDSQDGVPTPDKQPDQEGKVIDFIPAKTEASQTGLITKAVEKT